MTRLHSTSLDCRSCEGTGAVQGPAGTDACRSCASRAEVAWRRAHAARPMPPHLTPSTSRPHQVPAAEHRSIA